MLFQKEHSPGQVIATWDSSQKRATEKEQKQEG